MLLIILIISLGCWCWLGHGPRCCRWPLVVVLVLLTSGHQAGAVVRSHLEMLAGPLLTLGIVLLGLWIMVRSVSGGPRVRKYYHHRRDWHGRGW